MNTVLMKRVVSVILCIGVFAFLFSRITTNPVDYIFSSYPTRTVVFPDGTEITAYRATTQSEREQGLSGTTSLSQKDGMLFEFPYENLWYFWMKDMTIPIDIIWISKDMSVVHIEHTLDSSTFPNSFGPKQSALYVLEVASGVSKKVNLKVGDKIIFRD